MVLIANACALYRLVQRSSTLMQARTGLWESWGGDAPGPRGLQASQYRYPQHQMLAVRTAILDDLQEHLKAEPAQEVLWAISTIGCRTPRINNLIWPLLQQGDDLSDTALATLVGLGVTPDDCDRLLDLVRDRLSAARLTRGKSSCRSRVGRATSY